MSLQFPHSLTHRPYDCSINLLPRASAPKGRLYSLSASKTLAMREYIQSSLQAGIIHPLSSPAGADFFFAHKKDKTLLPCIDYRGLNNITVKNRYPLCWITSSPEPAILGTVGWEVEEQALQAQNQDPVPEGCPLGCLFAPADLRSAVVHWAHSSLLSCHPGTQRTLARAQQQFWWAILNCEVKEYISACPICACCKGSNNATTRLLTPLSTPSRPWFHISVDFVSGLPPSDGSTTILTIVDRFPRWCT